LVELLFEQPYSKIDFVVNKINVERKAASRYLQKLENIGIFVSNAYSKVITLFRHSRLVQVDGSNAVKGWQSGGFSSSMYFGFTLEGLAACFIFQIPVQNKVWIQWPSCQKLCSLDLIP
jgi:hypothetical protein